MKHQISIEGMSCGGCASRIATSLQADSGVSRAVVDYATRTGVVEGEVSLEDVKKIVSKAGYKVVDERHSDVPSQSFTKSIWSSPEILNLGFAGAVAVCVMVLSMGPWHGEFGVAEGVLSTVFLAGPGRHFILRAAKQLRLRTVTMDSLVSLGMLSAWVMSWVMLRLGHRHLYFESAVMIGFFVLLGKALEDFARQKSIGDVDKLVRLRPKTVWLLKSYDSIPEEVQISRVELNDLIYVRPGDMVALDGIVLESPVTVDESVVTGEVTAQLKRPGDIISSGTINAGATGIKLQVNRVGLDTTIEQMISMIEDARMNRPNVQAFADKVSAVFVPIVLVISLLTFFGWIFLKEASFEFSVTAALSVLVVACPCALGLATPVAWVAGLGRAARAGILVRSYEALERLMDADTIVFDKTGTLTEGEPKVSEVFGRDGEIIDPKNLSAIRSALTLSSHPLARASAKWIKEQNLSQVMLLSKLIEEKAGDGVTCELVGEKKGVLIRYGKLSFVTSLPCPESWLSARLAEKSQMAVSIDGIAEVLFLLEDLTRPDVKEGLIALKNMNKRMVIASGDKTAVVAKLAEIFPEISSFHGDLKPEDKRHLVVSLQREGHVVAFVGDGINDAAALGSADVGLSMGSGTDVAAHASGLVLQRSDVGTIAQAVILSKRITEIIRQNFFWAFSYNIIAIPFAVLGKLTPTAAALAMALSSVSVVLNALRLRR